MAGYSTTPLPKKLGIKPGAALLVLNPPPAFVPQLGELPGTTVLSPTDAAPAGVIVLFTRDSAILECDFPFAIGRLATSGGLWVAWPKRSSGVPTDLDENRVRAIGLSAGLVDNKVCAIDETWSGLRFVYRLKDRPARKAAPSSPPR